jgi:oligopeptide/dipeptide ABC transporter ATP-binding protein
MRAAAPIAAAGPAAAGPPALRVTGLTVAYGGLPAVDNVSLQVRHGQVVVLIGETSSGKSSLALAVARLLPAAAAVGGLVEIAGTDLATLGSKQARRQRASLVGYIAQDAMAALNPVLPVGRQLAELFTVHAGLSRAAAAERAVGELARVRIDRPHQVAHAYPHQLSGGMRQRVMIAMAMALSPPLLIADEPTTALDVSTQAEILALVGALQAEIGAGVLWITHDMGVVAELADWVAVMYAGRVVEQGPVQEVFDRPLHPYTEGLLRTRRDLRAGRPGEPLYQIAGSPPGLTARRGGCGFAPRCSRRTSVCDATAPDLLPASGRSEGSSPQGDTTGRLAACHHPLSDDSARTTAVTV